MCEFISWVEKGDKCYFLTKAQMDSPLGQSLKERFPGNGELIGHTAIRAYYDIVDGRDKECTDFSTPANFPEPIRKAILDGSFNGVALPNNPEQLLTLSCLSTTPFYAEWKKAYAEWKKAYVEWKKAYAEWEKALFPIFWGLFAIPKNRTEAWR